VLIVDTSDAINIKQAHSRNYTEQTD